MALSDYLIPMKDIIRLLQCNSMTSTRKETIKNSSEIMLSVTDVHPVHVPSWSKKEVAKRKKVRCAWEKETKSPDYNNEKQQFKQLKSKLYLASCLFQVFILLVLKRWTILYITSLCREYISFYTRFHIFFFMGTLNVNRHIDFQVILIYIYFGGKSGCRTFSKLTFINVCRSITFRERNGISSSYMLYECVCEYFAFLCNKIQKFIKKVHLGLHNTICFEETSYMYMVSRKEVNVTKVLLLRKLMRVQCAIQSKSDELERISSTQRNTVHDSKLLNVCKNEDKNHDSINEHDISSGFIMNRWRHLFHVSAEVLTWRLKLHIPIYYMLKQPNSFMENTLFRLSTYSNWPEKAPQIFSSYLVDAGFYFDAKSNEILCFSCGLCINITELEYHSSRYSLIRMHLQYSERCDYALQKMKEVESRDTVDGQQSMAQRTESKNTSLETAQSAGFPSLYSSFPAVPKSEDIRTMPTVTPATERDLSYSSMQFVHPTSGEEAIPLCVSSSNQEVILPSGNMMHHDVTYRQKPQQLMVESSATAKPRIYKYDLKHPEYKETEDRVKSFRTSSTPEILLLKVADIVVAGFFYTGDSDIVRCFCCDMGLAEWMEEDLPWEEHAKHSPRCPYLLEEMGEEYVSRIQAEWSKIYSPKHPAYSDYNVRLDSFRRFPESVTQSRHEIAVAGFFYTGELDIVRCHYCDGGLRDWEPGDEPWLEHAKWFPFCKYLLKVKGRDFIESAVRSVTDEQTPEEEAHHCNRHHKSESSQERLTYQSTTNDLDPEVTSVLQSLGYNRNTINRAVAEYRHQRGNRPYNADEIMNIILDVGERAESTSLTVGGTANQSDTTGSRQNNYWQEVAAGDKENKSEEILDAEEIRNQIICVKCKVNERRILFTPCGHRILCEKCSSGISKCVSCGKKIKHKLKTYLS